MSLVEGAQGILQRGSRRTGGDLGLRYRTDREIFPVKTVETDLFLSPSAQAETFARREAWDLGRAPPKDADSDAIERYGVG